MHLDTAKQNLSLDNFVLKTPGYVKYFFMMFLCNKLPYDKIFFTLALFTRTVYSNQVSLFTFDPRLSEFCGYEEGHEKISKFKGRK